MRLIILLFIGVPVINLFYHQIFIRISFGLYNNYDEIDLFIYLLNEISLNRQFYKDKYKEMMEDSDTPDINAFMKGALNKGVNMNACKLSCEVMGFSEDEFLKEVKIVTAEDYLNDALDSNIQLFI